MTVILDYYRTSAVSVYSTGTGSIGVDSELSPMSDYITRILYDSCLYYRWIDYDENGQPIYEDPITVSARIAPLSVKELKLLGDINLLHGFEAILPAVYEINTKDKFTFSHFLDGGPITVNVEEGRDWQGRKTHTRLLF